MYVSPVRFVILKHMQYNHSEGVITCNEEEIVGLFRRKVPYRFQLVGVVNKIRAELQAMHNDGLMKKHDGDMDQSPIYSLSKEGRQSAKAVAVEDKHREFVRWYM